jgi:hypothetical protein
MLKQLSPANDTDPVHQLAADIRNLRRELSVQRRALELLQAENAQLKADQHTGTATTSSSGPVDQARLDSLENNVRKLASDMHAQRAWANDRSLETGVLLTALCDRLMPWFADFNSVLETKIGLPAFVHPIRLPPKPSNSTKR